MGGLKNALKFVVREPEVKGLFGRYSSRRWQGNMNLDPTEVVRTQAAFRWNKSVPALRTILHKPATENLCPLAHPSLTLRIYTKGWKGFWFQQNVA
jgi:hypothetical protein